MCTSLFSAGQNLAFNWLRVAALCLFSVPTADVHATRLTDDQQDRAHIQCMIKNKVNPPDIPREIDEQCLNEAGVHDPGEAERQAKGGAWRSCLIKTATELDDGISPAGDVGKAIIVHCRAQWRGYVASLWMAPGTKRMMSMGFDEYAVTDGVQAVLLTRRVKREMQSAPTGKRN